MKVPRLEDKYVQDIMADDYLPVYAKARSIYRHNYDMTCLETDGKLPTIPSLEQVVKAIEEHNG